MSAPTPASYPAGSCVFESQHYRKNVCKLCFLPEGQHAPRAIETSTTSVTPAATTSTSSPVQQTSKKGVASVFFQRRNEAIMETTTSNSSTITPGPSILPEQPLPVLHVEAEEAPDDDERDQVLTRNHLPNEEQDESKQKVADENESKETEEENEVKQEEEAVDEIDDIVESDEVADDAIPLAPDVTIFPAYAPGHGPRSQSVSASASSTSAANYVSTRSALLQSITSGTRLRRSSEHAPLKPKAIVVDLNTELGWAMRKKGLGDVAKATAAKVVTQMPEEVKQELQQLAHRLSVLGANQGFPATIELVQQFIADREEFIHRHKTLLGKASTNFEDLEATWQTPKFELVARFGAMIQRLAGVTRALRKYTAEFELDRERKKNGAAPIGRNESLHSDWIVIDPSLLGQAITNLLDCLDACRKLVIDSEGTIFIDLQPAIDDSSAAASTLIDLLFEKCRLAYAATFSASITSPTAAATSAVTQTPNTGSSSITAKLSSTNKFTPHYSQTSKAIKSYQTLDLSLTMFDKLFHTWSPANHNLFIQFSLAQRELCAELKELKLAIESSPEYKASIAVSQRRGTWDKKEEVKLRSTSFSGPLSASNGSHGRRESTTANGNSWIQPLKELKEAHPRLFLLLEKPALAANLSPKSATVPSGESGSLDNDDQTALGQIPLESELITLLRPLHTLSLPLLTQFTLRHIIPVHNILAFQFMITNVFLPALHSATMELNEDVQTLAIQLYFECATKGFKEGILMCIHPANSLSSSSVTLDLDVNIRSHLHGNGGNTALHLAATNLHIDVMTLLIRHGANPLMINSFERNALFPLRALFPTADLKPSVRSPSDLADDSQKVVNHAVSYMSKYFNSPRLSDVKLRIQSSESPDILGEFWCHRLVLCAQSDVFRVMLDEDHPSGQSSQSQWASSLEDELDRSGPPSVLIPDVSDAAAFQLFLRYFYTGSILFTNDDLNLPANVLQLSTRFLVEPLRVLIAQHLSKKIVSLNAESLYNLSLFNSSRLLKEQVEQYLICHYDSFMTDHGQSHKFDSPGDALEPHGFLLRLLSGLDVTGLQAAMKEKKPKWHV